MPTNLTESLTDVLSFVDWQSTDSNTLSLLDSISVNLVNTPNLGVLVIDTITLSDSTQYWVGISNVLTDSVVFTDSPGSVGPNDFISIPDFINFVDFVFKSSIFYFTFNDSFSLQDAVTIVVNSLAQPISVSVSDQYQIVDIIFVGLNIAALGQLSSDSLSLGDNIVYELFPSNIYINDAIAFQDQIKFIVSESFNTYLRRYLNDYVNQPPSQGQPNYFFSGSSQPQFQFPNQSSETLPVPAAQPPLLFSGTNWFTSDGLSLQDSIIVSTSNISTPLTESVSDSYTLSDAISTNLYNLQIGVADTLTFLDQFNYASSQFVIPVSDSLSLADSNPLILLSSQYMYGTSDSLIFTDSIIQQFGNINLLYGDTINLTDSILVVPDFGREQMFDSYSLTDSVSIAISQEVPMNVNFAVGEVPTVNNLIATLLHVPVTGTDAVYVNELRLRRNVDYSILSNVITLVNWNAGDNIQVDYQYLS